MPARIPQSVREEQLNALPGKRFVRWVGGYADSDSKAVMICDMGHEWSACIRSLLSNGSGCPKCAGKYAYLTKDREEQLKALPGMSFVRWLDVYRNKDSKAVMRCIDGHEWSASVGKLVNKGTGCPKCAGNPRYSAVERELQLSVLPDMSFVRWVDKYGNQKSKAIMCCGLGHEWAASVDSLLRGSGCPKCAKVYRHSATEREAQLDALTNMNFVRWSEGSYKNSHSKATMSCRYGHEWDATVDSLLRGHGCPSCAGLYRYPAKERENQLAALPGKIFVRWEDEYRNCYSKATMRCSDQGHEWSASVDNLLRGRGCPSCAKSGYDPTKPGAIYALLHENGGHVKIGISNVYKQRLSQLRNATPFNFEPTHIHYSADGHAIRNLEKAFHQNFEKSGFTGFDGATEWLKFNPNILAIMRMIGA